MAQLRILHVDHGREIDINPDQVEAIEWSDGSSHCLIRMRSGRHHFPVQTRDTVRYILTMRNPRKHMDPLPDWMERPGVTVSNGHEQRGVLQRRRGEPALASDEGLPPSGGFGSDEERDWREEVVARSEATAAGWNVQQQIAIAFYDAHVVGYNQNGE